MAGRLIDEHTRYREIKRALRTGVETQIVAARPLSVNEAI
jgi:hypothetical protein